MEKETIEEFDQEMVDKLLEGKNTPIADCIPEEEEAGW